MRRSRATSRRSDGRARQVDVLVAHLAGDRHRLVRGRVAGPAGDERFDLIQEAEYLSQSVACGRGVVPVQVERCLEAGGGQLRHPGFCCDDGGSCGLPPPLRDRDHA